MGLKSIGGGKGRVFLSINGKTGGLTESRKSEETGKWESHKLDSNIAIEGAVIGLESKNDEIDGRAITRAVVLMADPEPGNPDLQVEFTIWGQSQNSDDPNVGDTTRFGLGVLAAINAADLTKPLQLRPWFMAKGTRMPDGGERTSDGAGVTVYQGGHKLKPAFIENGKTVDRLAPLPSTVFAGKTLYDKTGWTQVAQDLFASIQDRLNPAPADADNHHDDDEGIDPAEAAQAAQSAPRAR
jgi:hypothetical protein